MADIAASVLAKLKNKAKASGISYQQCIMISYNELLQKYNAALKTITDLQTENRQLKARLGISEIAPTANDETEKPTINKYSSTDEKIALFRKLFCGRNDVFARRWNSKTTEKSGYQPVCENEWAEGLCDKKAYTCSACPNRKLSPLTDKAIYNHLAGKDEYGRDVIGIYPMLENDTCRFLCADFDDADYEKDVLAYKTACEKLQIPVAIERSGSATCLSRNFCENFYSRKSNNF